jgi:ABC-type multidrug transport system fused ATPase/permease subunit
VIVIAHKIKTILKSDKILVMEAGRSKEFDSPENLLNNPNSIFSEIIRLMYEAKE